MTCRDSRRRCLILLIIITVHVEQEYRSFDRRHFLEHGSGIQIGESETQADKVMPIRVILYALYRFYNLYALFAGSSGSILDFKLRATCGRTRGHWLHNPLINWMISFIHPSCVPRWRGYRCWPYCGRRHLGACRLSLLRCWMLQTTFSRDGWCNWSAICNEFQPKCFFCFEKMLIIEKIFAIIVI